MNRSLCLALLACACLFLSACGARMWDAPNYSQALCAPQSPCGQSRGLPSIPLVQGAPRV